MGRSFRTVLLLNIYLLPVLVSTSTSRPKTRVDGSTNVSHLPSGLAFILLRAPIFEELDAERGSKSEWESTAPDLRSSLMIPKRFETCKNLLFPKSCNFSGKNVSCSILLFSFEYLKRVLYE